jgi:hypothetical protein
VFQGASYLRRLEPATRHVEAGHPPREGCPGGDDQAVGARSRQS